MKTVFTAFYVIFNIHGVEINLTSMSKAVLCEIIHLSEYYELIELHTDLKCYLSKIKRFNKNSVVTLLNTAMTYDLEELYERLKIYVYQNTELMIKHKSFLNLQHNVLIDLLKSDWLYSEEIDILKAALTWHNENIINSGIETNKDEIMSRVDVEIKSENINDMSNNEVDDSPFEIKSEENFDDMSNSEVDDSRFEIHLVEQFLSNYSEDLFDGPNSDDDNVTVLSENETVEIIAQDVTEHVITKFETENNNAEERVNNSVESASPDNSHANKTVTVLNSDENQPKSNQNGIKIVKMFSENILNTLLTHIRFFRIPMFDFVDALDTELFTKYKDSILNVRKTTKLNNEPRSVYSGITKKFTIEVTKVQLELPLNGIYSKENYLIENMNWKVFILKNPTQLGNETSTKPNSLRLFLLCSSDMTNWSCDDALLFTKLISNKPFVSDVYRRSSLSKTYTDKKIWRYENFISFSELFNVDNGFIQDDIITVEVHLRTERVDKRERELKERERTTERVDNQRTKQDGKLFRQGC
ncbi:uncharacterized protein LOC108252794 isoform X4 [Diaphorina citri]|uniref:Uncharacterized protein LOC108252794 isoform X4 n=1 Tax=Diaphorina citri TaxID=121845 RepID=A0A1S4EFM7_DIACI|nr:uncharacterized protein LOC108252794 isoform X4 [Diaphorina citri]